MPNSEVAGGAPAGVVDVAAAVDAAAAAGAPNDKVGAGVPAGVVDAPAAGAAPNENPPPGAFGAGVENAFEVGAGAAAGGAVAAEPKRPPAAGGFDAAPNNPPPAAEVFPNNEGAAAGA